MGRLECVLTREARPNFMIITSDPRPESPRQAANVRSNQGTRITAASVLVCGNCQRIGGILNRLYAGPIEPLRHYETTAASTHCRNEHPGNNQNNSTILEGRQMGTPIVDRYSHTGSVAYIDLQQLEL